MSRVIECPRCQSDIDCLWEYGDNEEGTFEIECPSCDAPLLLTRTISVDYEIVAKPDES